MSRTHHHSFRWGPDHRCSMRPSRTRRHRILHSHVGEAPGWHVRMHFKRPGRIEDKRILRLIGRGCLDPDAAVFWRNGNRKPHDYYL